MLPEPLRLGSARPGPSLAGHVQGGAVISCSPPVWFPSRPTGHYQFGARSQSSPTLRFGGPSLNPDERSRAASGPARQMVLPARANKTPAQTLRASTPSFGLLIFWPSLCSCQSCRFWSLVLRFNASFLGEANSFKSRQPGKHTSARRARSDTARLEWL